MLFDDDVSVVDETSFTWSMKKINMQTKLFYVKPLVAYGLYSIICSFV